jgi:hypothetical protein
LAVLHRDERGANNESPSQGLVLLTRYPEFSHVEQLPFAGDIDENILRRKAYGG